jgi:hypothetical protein
MQPEAGQVELLRARRLVKPRQNAGNLVGMIRVQLALVVVFVRTVQAAMPKSAYHARRIQ